MDPKFSDRLYLVNNAPGKQSGKGSQSVWNNPVGGAMEWDENSNVFIIDTKGEIRWYFDNDKLMNWDNIYNRGIMMGFHQNKDGALTWGFGQRYVKYDVLGREIFNRKLPAAYIDESDKFGDIAGIGRNWAHVNSVDYDPSDDSIIISSRYQSAVVKIGRDKKIKWILGAHEGWNIVCDDDYSKCPGYENENGGFDFTWTQHTGWRIDSKSNKRYIYISVFDNGDARGAEQPAFTSQKYSRAVIYKIDQQNKTVEMNGFLL